MIGPENAHHSSQPVKCKTKTNHIFVFLIGMCDYLSFDFYNTQLKSASYVSRVNSFFQLKTFYLNEKVDKTKGQDYDQKNWSREANGSDGSQNATERSQEHNQSHGNLIIDCADILREAVHDPPQRSGLKK